MNSAEILKSTETDTFNKNLISSDIDLLNKVKQVMELTGCSNDIAVTTLFDSNYNIEVAIDKIFDQTQRQLGSATNKTTNDWKEVAKNKKKPSTTETSGVESNTESMIKELADFKISNDKLRSIHRGTGRGRARFNHNNGRNNYDKQPQINDKDNLLDTSGQVIFANKGGISRGRGRKSQYRVNSISHRGRSKHYGMNPDSNANIFDGNFDVDTERFLPNESNKWNANYDVCNDWLSDNTAKSNEYFESDRHPYDNQHCDDNVLPNPSNSALNTESNGSNFVESCIEPIEKSNDIQTLTASKDVKPNQLNPLELVAKCSNKVDIFGGYSRTKPPALSSKVPSEPVKLLTSTGGVVRSNKTGFNFSFGLNFDEYSHTVDGENSIGTIKSIVDSSESFISKIISNKQPPLSAAITTISNKSPNEYHQTNFSKSDSRLPPSGEKATSIMKSKQQHQPLSASNEIFSPGPNNQRSGMDVTEKNLLSSDTSTSGYKLSDDNHQPLNTTILSSSSQLCHPPGMSNAHMFQHFPNNQPYFSLLNISNGSSIFNSSCNMNSVNDFGDLAIGSSDDTAHQFMHADKEYNHKPVLPNANSKHSIGVGVGGQSIPTNSSSINQQILLSKISDSDSNSHSSTILPAMPMSNICCFPPMYMNNFTNFMPAQVPPGHSNQPQTAPESTQSPVSNKAIYNLQNSHRNYQMSDEFDDMIQNQNKGKYQRTPNYVSNFGVTGVSNKSSSQDVDSLDVDKTTKLASTNTAQINRQSNQPQNLGSANRTNQQQSMSNDPRFLTFHQHQGHPYQNNMFNCVTATGAHPTAPHPYAMAHQGGGMQQLHTQLHLMPQQMHSFPQSYQYQEHILPSMVSNPSSRNNISQGSASSGNQSRNNRSSNQLWNPSN